MNPRVPRVVAAMKRGGYFDRVMAAGPELDRVKRFLRILAGDEPPAPAPDGVEPEVLPVFPGLRLERFMPPLACAAALEAGCGAAKAEAARLDPARYLERAIGSSLDGGSAAPGWRLFPLSFMGARLPFADDCPATARLLAGLPGSALRWPFSDAMLSSLEPRWRITPHCSADGLRVRGHLALDVPAGCWLEVGGERRGWTEGRALFFTDAFRHGVANESGRRRLVLISDFWHPDLSPAETAALEAGFRRSDVRRVLFDHQLDEMSPETRREVEGWILPGLAAADREDAVRRWWD